MLDKRKDILTMKKQYEIRDAWTSYRIHMLLPKLMEECGVNLWVILCGEYNEDPIFKTITPALMQSASRTSCLIFSRKESGEFRAISMCRPNPMLYTHPIGVYGHGSGPLFGLYDAQGPVAIRGELPLKDRTCYALELNVTEKVPEWNDQDVFFYIEETIAFVDGTVKFMDPAGRCRIAII